jgi:hypothetical protein
MDKEEHFGRGLRVGSLQDKKFSIEEHEYLFHCVLPDSMFGVSHQERPR